MQGLSLGGRERLLELLRVVSGASAAPIALRGEYVTLIDEMLLLDGASAPDRQRASVGGGEFVAYTCGSPDKDTDNEDTVAIIPFGPGSAVFVVADGAGGLPAGKRASLTAVSVLAKCLRSARAESMLLRTAILDGIEAANIAVQNLVNGAATTLTVIAIEGLHVRAYQIGDSEAMIVGNRGRVTLHTPVQSPTGLAVEAGFLDQHEALHHAERHLVSNFLGTTDMRIDVGTEVRLKPRDTVMIASDGLMDNVHVEEIVDRIRVGSIDTAATAVIELAKRRMAGTAAELPSKPDDLSLILYRKPGRQADKLRKKPIGK